MLQDETRMERPVADIIVESTKAIDKHISQSLEQDRFNNEKYFLPRGSLTAICTKAAVYHHLQQHFEDDEAERYAAYVCGEAHEIFAILVLIKNVSIISKFVEEKISDKDLPFGGSANKTALWKCGSSEKDPIKLFEGPDDGTRREFYNKQWWVHVPVVALDGDDRPRRYDLPSGTVLPWTRASEEFKEGGFGKVRRVEMHEDHHRFTYKAFALKTLSPEFNISGNKEIFTQEMAAFKKLRRARHLLELCAAFTIDSKFMLLFPWAEGGSLLDLWTASHQELCEPLRRDSSDFVEWIAMQCRGLVEGLQMIHKIKPDDAPGADGNESCYGIHGDIKPAKILYFSEETDKYPFGVLKIADFGLMKFHRKGSRSKHSPGTAGAADLTYRSPEHEVDQIMSNKVDIWALGCVFSEMLTWIPDGPKGIEEYRRKRCGESRWPGDRRWHEDNFFAKAVIKKQADRERPQSQSNILQSTGKAEGVTWRVRVLNKLKRVLPSRKDSKTSHIVGRVLSGHYEEQIILKKSVIEWIDDRIANAGPGPTFLTDFLAFIKDQMLHPQRESRAHCGQVLEFFQDCFGQARDLTHYWALRGVLADQAGGIYFRREAPGPR